MRRRLATALLITCVLLSGCAAEPSATNASPETGIPASSPTPPVSPSSRPSPTASLDVPSASEAPGDEPTTREIGEACVRVAESLGPGFADIADDVAPYWESSRSAMRPDGLWYFVIQSGEADEERAELRCLMETDLSAARMAEGRLVPSETDDFPEWASGQEALDGP